MQHSASTNYKRPKLKVVTSTVGALLRAYNAYAGQVAQPVFFAHEFHYFRLKIIHQSHCNRGFISLIAK
jgi:hypothetical protein